MKSEYFGALVMLVGGIILLGTLVNLIVSRDWVVVAVTAIATAADFYACATMALLARERGREPA